MSNYKNLIGKNVLFTSKIEEMECNIDSGMKARIRNIVPKHLDMKDPHDHLYIVYFDLEAYNEHNEPLMQCNYYDKQGRPVLNVKEAGQYEEIESVYFGSPELWPFEGYFTVVETP